jgi:predicted GTPase
VASDDSSTELLGVLVRLREALAATELSLEASDVDTARSSRRELIDQLEDYVLPRLLQADAPLLAVVGGSTGAGKSTLVNTLVGERVSEPGVLRPTTRSPVLVHHPDDVAWFDQSRVLPDLARTTGTPGGAGTLHLVASDNLPQGLAMLDAPDIDSVEEANRQLAGELLAAADLWLFVTSASRYADQVPWDLLKVAAERSTAVAMVLDRTAPDSELEVSSHLSRMLTSRGLGEAPLFCVHESPLDERGLLPEEAVASVREWLHSLADDASAREAVVRQTLEGAVRSLSHRTRAVADAARLQHEVATDLRADVDQAYDEGIEAVDAATQDGTLLRGEVLARWQEFVGTGELLKSLEERIGWFRDRVVNAVRGRPQTAQRLTVAVESGLETLLLEHAESAAERVENAWRASPAGRHLLEAHGGDLGRASRGFMGEAERAVRDWQRDVLDMVREEGADKRSRARFLAYGVNGLSVALMVVVFSASAGLTGAEIGIAGGSAAVGQKLLEAVFGDQAVRRLAAQARSALRQRVEALLGRERQRFLEVLDAAAIDPDTAGELRQLCRDVEDARLEGVA